jgi:hypothetical protein
VLSWFVTGNAAGTGLDIPRVCFRPAEILFNPRWVAHEFKHVRPEMASEGRREDLLGGRGFPDMATEIEAKLEEAQFVREFDILS